MNRLAAELVKGILSEAEVPRKEIVGMFGGGFKPPTVGHLEVVKRALDENPEMDRMVVLVGSGERDSITQAESLAIWRIYQKYLPKKVEVQPAPEGKAPIAAVYSYAKNNPDKDVYWFLGAREGNEDDSIDIIKRTKSLQSGNYPNVTVKKILTGGTVSGTKTRKALLARDKETFIQALPDIPEVDQIWDMLSDTMGINEEKHPIKPNHKLLAKKGAFVYHEGKKLFLKRKKFYDVKEIIENQYNLEDKQGRQFWITKSDMDDKWGKYDSEELKKGIEVEKEHTDNPKIAMKIALDHLDEDPRYYTKLATLGLEERVNFNADFITKGDVEFVDDMADRKLAPVDVDLSGGHFFDRLNDPRNFPDISIDELEEFFDKLADEKEEFIDFLKKYKDVVVKDTDTNINIPFMKLANKAIAKTIMRKKNFKTPNKVLPLQEINWGNAPSYDFTHNHNDGVVNYTFHTDANTDLDVKFFLATDSSNITSADARLNTSKLPNHSASHAVKYINTIGKVTQHLHNNHGVDWINFENTGKTFNLYSNAVPHYFPNGKVLGDNKGATLVINENKLPLLLEGRYDAEVTMISRMIINVFKDSLGEEVTETFEDAGELKGEPYNLELYLRPTDFDTLGPTPFIINAAGDADAIAIQINYNPDSFPKAYNELIPELKDAIRHELEHTGQGRFDKGVMPDGIDQDDLPLFDYLTLDYEIPAFVQGIYKQAKTRKIKFSQALQNFLDERADELTPDEEAKVKKIYTDFAKKNLPAAQFESKDPKKGTGKKPKGSGRRLYTDEDPSDTVKVKFSTRQDIVDTLSKKSFKAKSHARQSQVINLIHQRVRAAYGRAKKPEVKKRLKTALDYITKRKEASKKKTQRLKDQKKKTNEALEGAKRIDYYLNYYINVDENVAPNHNQKSTPYGSGYKQLKEEITPQIISLTQYMGSNGLNLKPYPKIKFINNDVKNAEDLLGRTAYYDPNQQLVALYTMGRHPKDILRSYAHELVHHHQNLNNTLDHSQTTNTNEDGDLDRIEREAYETGNILFRNWEDSIKNGK